MSDITRVISFVAGNRSGLDLLRDGQRELDKHTDSLESLRREALDAADASSGLNRTVSGGAGGFGRASNAVERLANNFGGLGGELLGIANDAGDVIEAVGKQGLSGALAALASPLGAVTIGIGAVVGAFALLSASLEDERKAVEATVRAFTERRQIEREIRDEALATDEVQKRLADARQERADAEADLTLLNLARTKPFLDAQRDGGDLMGRLAVSFAEGRGAFTELDKAIVDATKRLEDATIAVQVYEAALDDPKLTDTTARHAQMLADEAKAAEQANDRLERLSGALDKSAKSAEAAEKALDAANAEFSKLQNTVQDTVDKLAADKSELSNSLRDTLADLNADLIDAQADANADILDAQRDFAAERAAAEADYQKESARAERDYRNELKRINRDFRQAELEGIRNNDILSIFEAKEAAKAQRKDVRERFKQEQADRAEDYADQRKVEEAALAARISDIQRARDAEIAAINEKIVAERASYDAQIALINTQRDAAIDAINAAAAARAATMTQISAGNGGAQPIAYPGGTNQSAADFFGWTPGGGVLPAPSAPQSAGPVYNFAPGAIVMKDLAEIADVEAAMRALIKGTSLAQQRVAA